MSAHPSFLEQVEQTSPVTRARATDPDTSHAAAESMTPAALRKQQAAVLQALAQIERHERANATAHELAMRLAYGGSAPAENVIVKRCRELEEFGLARETDERRPGGSGRTQIVWAITDAGRDAATS